MATSTFVPTVSASVDATDTAIGLDSPPYDGTLETDWANVGTNTRLKTIDAAYVSWNTAAFGQSSRRLDLSSWVIDGGSATIADTIPANATISEVRLNLVGDNDVSSVDLTQLFFNAGLRQQAAGGIVTPPNGSTFTEFYNDQIFSVDVGTWPFDVNIYPQTTLAGLSSADMLTVLRSSTMLLRSIFYNDTSSTFTFYLDYVSLAVTWEAGASTSDTLRARSAWRSRVR